jgi:thymidylate synthase ThyX
MFNWRSFAHFQKLRNDEHAQLEVRQVAQEMLRLVEEQGDFPMTIHAMRECGMLPPNLGESECTNTELM